MKQILRACGKCPVEPALVPRGTSILWWPAGAEVGKRGKQEHSGLPGTEHSRHVTSSKKRTRSGRQEGKASLRLPRLRDPPKTSEDAARPVDRFTSPTNPAFQPSRAS